MSGSTPGSGAGGDPGHPSRRHLVLGGTAAAVTSLGALTGCGLRLDLPQPAPPVPTRRRAPDEAFLLSVIAEQRALLKAADSLDPRGDDLRVVRALVAVLRRQVAVLTGRLTNAGVPAKEIEAATAPGRATSTPSPTAPPTAPSTSPTTASRATAIRTVDDLAAALAEIGPDRWRALATSTASTRDLVLAAWSSRLAAAVRLGESVDPPATASTARPRVIEQTAPLVYGFEVVAAQSTGARRTRALETLDGLRALDLAVSGPTTSTPGGWALPFPVTTPAAAQRLASQLLGTAVDALVDVAGTAPDAAALDDTARWSARVQALATDWGMPLVPFPGTST